MTPATSNLRSQHPAAPVAPEETGKVRLPIMKMAMLRLRRALAACVRPARLHQHSTDCWNCDAAYMIALAAIRQGEFQLAERELTNGNGDGAVSDARCLNLLGVVHECNARWGRARLCYSRALRADRKCVAARENLRRYYELVTFGKTGIPIQLGDEKGSRL